MKIGLENVQKYIPLWPFFNPHYGQCYALAPTTHTDNPTTASYVKQWLIMLLAINQATECPAKANEASGQS